MKSNVITLFKRTGGDDFELESPVFIELIQLNGKKRCVYVENIIEVSEKKVGCQVSVDTIGDIRVKNSYREVMETLNKFFYIVEPGK